MISLRDDGRRKAGYALAVLGSRSAAETARWWWAIVPIAVLLAVIASTFIGWLSVRTEGIYTIMITLAIGVAFYYLVLQNYSIFNGFQGLREIYPPKVFGVAWRDPLPFYFLCLACSLAGYGMTLGGRRRSDPLQGTSAENHGDERTRLPRRAIGARLCMAGVIAAVECSLSFGTRPDSPDR